MLTHASTATFVWNSVTLTLGWGSSSPHPSYAAAVGVAILGAGVRLGGLTFAVLAQRKPPICPARCANGGLRLLIHHVRRHVGVAIRGAFALWPSSLARRRHLPMQAFVVLGTLGSHCRHGLRRLHGVHCSASGASWTPWPAIPGLPQHAIPCC